MCKNVMLRLLWQPWEREMGPEERGEQDKLEVTMRQRKKSRLPPLLTTQCKVGGSDS